MDYEEKLAEAKARLAKAKPKLKQWRESVKDVEEPDLILSGQFDELTGKRIDKQETQENQDDEK